MGNFIDMVLATSFQECQTICQNTTDCNFVTYFQSENQCNLLLNRDFSKITFNENYISGPKECNSICSWSAWMNSMSETRGRGDDEKLAPLVEKYGNSACLNPQKIEVRSTETGQYVMNLTYPQTFSKFDNITGFSCNLPQLRALVRHTSKMG